MANATSEDLYSFLKGKGLTPDEETSTDDRPPVENRASGPQPFLTFDADNLGAKLQQASHEQLDKADFGIVRVDDQGHVEFYNQYESNLAGVAKEDAKGKNFFTQLAPCSNNRIFQGRFKKGVRSGEMDETFTYTFTYKMRPTLVDIRLVRDSKSDNWVMVRKR